LNYLAHLHLSGNNSEVMLGNFIADSVRRSQRGQYSELMQRGIELHHVIDSFTDVHPIVKRSKDRLRPAFGHYTAVIIDVLYDHFLAASWASRHSGQELPAFAESFYKLLNENLNQLPERIQSFGPYMITHNWLVGYAQLDGIERALTGLSRRASNPVRMQDSIALIKADYAGFQAEFEEFYPELEKVAADFLLQI
jgi:acyl carrier protein phosphodiesterase